MVVRPVVHAVDAASGAEGAGMAVTEGPSGPPDLWCSTERREWAEALFHRGRRFFKPD